MVSQRVSFHTSSSSLPRQSDIDSSGFLTEAYESSNNFVAGDYEHNLEIMENLEGVSLRDDVDEDRLIRLATTKFARDAKVQSRRQIVVSSEELNSDSTHRLNRGSSELLRTSGMDQLRTFFMIFRGDDSYMEVSREEIQRVRVMHKRFMETSEFSFNYNTLLIIASIIAALGLGGNSNATIIASMLVSPLMGPVMGMAYGATIHDLKLFYVGFKTELISLFACIGVGAIVSACMIPFYEDLSSDNGELFTKHWPTHEMTGRTRMSNFYIGIPIAFFSGLGVAVSILDEQTSSLVGVAISASLLPPAINAGMLWTTYLFRNKYSNESDVYVTNPKELFDEGLISLALTLVNILMIVLSSMLMFRLKERLPIRNKKIFWTDLSLARKIYQNLALYEGDVGPMRRVGHRVSLMFASTTMHVDSDRPNNRATRTRTSMAGFGDSDRPNNRATRTRTSMAGSGDSDRPSNRAARTRTSMAASNNHKVTGTAIEVPNGSEDADFTTRTRALSTVTEERMSGYSSA